MGNMTFQKNDETLENKNMTLVNDIIEKLAVKLTDIIGNERVMRNEDMRMHTSFRAGGHAAVFAIVESVYELSQILKLVQDSNVKYMILGNGTNMLVKDAGYAGVLIKLGENFSKVEIEGVNVRAGASALMSSVAKEALNANLSGFEFASGIPGSIGGAAFMNAGAYGGEIADIVKSADVISKDGSCTRTVNVKEMDLGYRHSIFCDTGDIVTSVTLQLTSGNREEISAKMKELMTKRNEKQPVNFFSAGSFFKRPEGQFAGKLIQEAGLKGLSVGGAQVSPLHAGFIVNTGGATATDILELMRVVQNIVRDKFGVSLEPEVRIIGD